MQHLMKNHGIEAVFRGRIRERQPVHIAAAHLAIEDAGLRQSVPRDREHFRAAVDPDPAPDDAGKAIPGFGPCPFRRPAPGQGARVAAAYDRAFHLSFRDMERADFFPLRGIGGKIARRLPRACLRTCASRFRSSCRIESSVGISQMPQMPAPVLTAVVPVGRRGKTPRRPP